MKKIKSKKGLLVTIILLQGGLFVTSPAFLNAKTKMVKDAPGDDWTPHILSCRNDKGVVVSYGSDCIVGDGPCIENECPATDPGPGGGGGGQ